MNIVAIDTSTATLSVSVGAADKTYTLSSDGLGQHAEQLSDFISEALRLANVAETQLDMIVCPLGPGSFTGLRLSWAAAKALQLASGCPLTAVSSLACYARSGALWPGVVISALDAKRQRFYTQVFRRGIAVTEPLDIHAGDVRGYLDPEERILITGPDAVLFQDELLSAHPALDLTCLPSATGGISADMLFFAKMKDSCYTTIVADHEGPLYVRKSDAEEHA